MNHPCAAQVKADALDFDASPAFDVVVANAFADLVFPETLCGALCRLGRPGAVAYLPITFAGETRLEPPLDVPGGLGDAEAFAAYHAHLTDVEKQHVDVDRLARVLRDHGMTVDVAASDWTIALGSGTADAAFAKYMADFLGQGVPPRFFGTPRAQGAVAWAQALQAAVDAPPTAAPRTLVVENRDLLLRFPDEEAAAPVENRKGRSHRRGDSLAQYLGL